MTRLDGEVALITGGARGLGRAFAHHLARLGASVGIIDADLRSFRVTGERVEGDTVVDELRDAGFTAAGQQADVTDKDAIVAGVERLANELGDPTILVTAAGGRGVVPDGPSLGPHEDQLASKLDIRRARAVFDVNVTGTMIAVGAVAPYLVRAGRGKIVTIGSVNGTQTRPFGSHADYATAKAAVGHYTRYLAADLGRFGITVNCLAPGLTITEKNRERYEGRPELTRHLAMDRLGLPEDQAQALEFLVSPASAYVTGVVLEVAGGTRVAWWGPEP